MSQHHLESYLNDILPKIGLDAETYAPYITGVLRGEDEEEEEEEELDGVIELLQASSESHCDEENIWVELKAAIKKKHDEFKRDVRLKKKKKDEIRQKEAEAKIQSELKLAMQSQEQLLKQKVENERKEKEMDPAKRALLAQYAYDESELYDCNGNLITESKTDLDPSKKQNKVNASTTSNESENNVVTKKVNKENARQARSTQIQTKKSEREKTKNAKQDKLKQKEERRKRTQKGERRR